MNAISQFWKMAKTHRHRAHLHYWPGLAGRSFEAVYHTDGATFGSGRTQSAACHEAVKQLEKHMKGKNANP